MLLIWFCHCSLDCVLVYRFLLADEAHESFLQLLGQLLVNFGDIFEAESLTFRVAESTYPHHRLMKVSFSLETSGYEETDSVVRRSIIKASHCDAFRGVAKRIPSCRIFIVELSQYFVIGVAINPNRILNFTYLVYLIVVAINENGLILGHSLKMSRKTCAAHWLKYCIELRCLNLINFAI